MTALTTIPAPALGAAPRPHRLDLPADHRLRVGGRRRTHRFPAPTYLSRSVAREERAIAQEALEATDRSASRRVGSLGGVVALLFGAALFLLATGRADTPTGGLALVGLGGLVGVAVLTLVGVLRRHEREHDVLTERVRVYDARLRELRPRR
jgi:hypothetical protein